jgi:hypothetical protein
VYADLRIRTFFMVKYSISLYCNSHLSTHAKIFSNKISLPKAVCFLLAFHLVTLSYQLK